MKQVKLLFAAIATIGMFAFATCGIDSAQAEFKDTTSFDLPGSPTLKDTTMINTKKNILDSVVNAKGFKAEKITAITLNNLTVDIDAKSPDSSALVSYGVLETIDLTINGVLVAKKSFDASDVSKTKTFTSVDLTTSNIKAILQGQANVNYQLHFKTRKPVPRITSKISYNATVEYEL